MQSAVFYCRETPPAVHLHDTEEMPAAAPSCFQCGSCQNVHMWRGLGNTMQHFDPCGGKIVPLPLHRSWAEQLAARRQAAAAARQQEAIDAAAVAAAAQAAAAADAAEAARRLARDRKCTAYLGNQVSEKQRRALAAKLADCEVRCQLYVKDLQYVECRRVLRWRRQCRSACMAWRCDRLVCVISMTIATVMRSSSCSHVNTCTICCAGGRCATNRSSGSHGTLWGVCRRNCNRSGSRRQADEAA